MAAISSSRIPTYRKHHASNLARVTIDGRTFYLGKYASAASRAAYDRLIGEWASRGRQLPADDHAITVAELILSYWRMIGSKVLGGQR